MYKSTRATEQGRGPKAYVGLILGKGTPAGANYKITDIFDYNLSHKKGCTMAAKFSDSSRNVRYMPGVGSYDISNDGKFGNIPTIIKSRQRFFYEDDLKKKQHCVSMQRYKPVYTLVESNRYDGAGIGYGNRFEDFNKNQNPGPGSYKLPGMYESYPFKKMTIN